jgi:hypothetical protein
MPESSKWITEGSKIDDFKIIYKNKIIETFLTDPEKHFIIAGKGIGKTALLRYKRHLMKNKARGVLFLPSDQLYLDVVEDLQKTLSTTGVKQINKIEFCEKFWRLAIQLYILSQTSIPESSITQLKEDVKLQKSSSSFNFDNDFNLLLNNEHDMDVVCNHLMSMGDNKLQKLFDISFLISELFKKSIQEPTYYFFDRFDQALKYSKAEIWYSMQQGLLEAAWNIMRDKSHVKIYISLRQEAYDAFSSVNKESMTSDISLINYTSKELHELITSLVKSYEGKDSLEDFLGIDKFKNTVVHDDEHIYQFMNRYSLGRPRDFVVFCKELTERVGDNFDNEEERARQLKEIIITASSSHIISGLHEEVRMLLKCLDTHPKFDNFVKLLSRNVLTYKELQKYCYEYNGSNCSRKCSKCKKDSPEKSHPFCDLYIMGLLGRIQRKDASSELRQVFKSPYEDITKAGIYGDSEEFYLIHPALRKYIKSLKSDSSSTYELYDCLLIGDGLPWTDKHTIITKINKNIDKINKRNAGSRNFFIEQLIYFAKPESAIKSYSKLTEEYRNTKTHVTQHDGKNISDILRLLSNEKDKKISVFVTYAFESEKYKEQVISFTNKLRKMGYEATMDEFLKREYPDIDAMMTEGLKRDKVVVLLSENYKEKADNMDKSGVWTEFKTIVNDIKNNNKKYIFVNFNSYSDEPPEKISPILLGNRWIVYLGKDKKNNYNELISYITDVSVYPPADVSDNTKKVKKKKIKDF